MYTDPGKDQNPEGENHGASENDDNPGSNAASLWKEILGELVEGKLGRDQIDRWFSDAAIQKVNGSSLTVVLPNQIHVLWVETYHRGDLEGAVSRVLGKEMRVDLEARDSESEELNPPTTDITDDEMAQLRPEKSDSTLPTKRRIRESNLNPAYDFDSFVVGDNSQYCWASAKAVAESPGKNYNPLLFYGKTGLGKTHLMTAIGHEVLRNKPRKKVLFVTGEEFTNDFIEALREGKISEFRNRYRRVDVLLIDDVQFMAGKDATQEEFFHTFNALINNRSQIVMTSDRPPGEIQRLEKRLLSRFHWGVYAEILPPGVETRIAILRQKAHDWKEDFDSTVLEFLATRIRANVRRLEGALRRLASFQSLYRGKVSVEQAEDYLRDILQEEGFANMVGIPDVQKTVANYFDIRVQDINGRRRTANLVWPRHVAMFLSREMTNCSLKEIGQAFGGRDHGTVIHACKRVQDDMDTKGDSKRIVEFIKGQLGQ